MSKTLGEENGLKAPGVSVIICVYNAQESIAETITSLLAQTYKKIEILVIDDGSTDDTASVCMSFAQSNPQIRLHSLDENLGVAHARRAGLHNCCYDILAYVDADDIAMPKMVEKMLSKLLSDEAVLGVSSFSTYFNKERDLGLQKAGPTTKDKYMQMYVKNKLIFLPNPTLVRKADILAAGGYRVDILPNPNGIRYADFCEDLDVWCRMSDLSVDGRYFITLPEPLFKYRKPDASLSTNNVRHMQNKMRWIKDCLIRRRSGRPEQGYGAFLSSRSIWVRFNNAREDCAAIFYKQAGLAYGARSYAKLIMFLVITGLFSPKLMVQKVKTQTLRATV